jgi:hypothetical protein
MKIPIWAIQNKHRGRMRPAGRQFDMPAVYQMKIRLAGQYFETDNGNSRAKHEVGRELTSAAGRCQFHQHLMHALSFCQRVTKPNCN